MSLDVIGGASRGGEGGARRCSLDCVAERGTWAARVVIRLSELDLFSHVPVPQTACEVAGGGEVQHLVRAHQGQREAVVDVEVAVWALEQLREVVHDQSWRRIPSLNE